MVVRLASSGAENFQETERKTFRLAADVDVRLFLLLVVVDGVGAVVNEAVDVVLRCGPSVSGRSLRVLFRETVQLGIGRSI